MNSPARTRPARHRADDQMADVRAWESGMERAVQRVIAGMTAFYVVVVATWTVNDWPDHSPVDGAVLIIGLIISIAVCVRAWRTQISMVDVAVMAVAMLSTLTINTAAHDDGIGLQGGPAYGFMALALLMAALTQPWQRFAFCVAALTPLYVLGRYLGGGSTQLMSGIDEAISDTSTIAAAAVIRVFYLRAGHCADTLQQVRRETTTRDARAVAAAGVAAEDRRLLHDEVIGALLAIEHSRGDDAAQVAVRARTALATFPSGGPPRRQDAPRLDLLEISTPVSIDIDPELTVPDAVPPPVAIAMSGAVNEALRNVERHAFATCGSLTIRRTESGGVTARIVDDGVGLSDSFTPGFGIRESMMSRMREIGGTATIGQNPDGGTIVELSWPDQDPARSPHHQRIPSTFANPLRFTYSVTATALAGQLWLVARHLHDARELAIAALTIMLIAGTAWYASRRAMTGLLISGATIGVTALLLWGLSVSPDGSLRTFDSWIVQLTSVLVFTVSFYVSVPALMTMSLSMAATMLTWCHIDPTLGLADASDPILHPVFYAAALGATGWGFRRLITRARREEEVAAREIIREATQVMRAQKDRQRFEHLRAELDPFFAAIESGDADVEAPETIDHARALAMRVRDEINLPGLLDADLRLLLTTAREAGMSITVRHSALTSVPDIVATLLRVAIDPTVQTHATLSLPQPGAPYTRLVLLPALDEPARERIADVLSQAHASVENAEHATVITIPASPTDVPPRGPS